MKNIIAKLLIASCVVAMASGSYAATPNTPTKKPDTTNPANNNKKSDEAKLKAIYAKIDSVIAKKDDAVVTAFVIKQMAENPDLANAILAHAVVAKPALASTLVKVARKKFPEFADDYAKTAVDALSKAPSSPAIELALQEITSLTETASGNNNKNLSKSNKSGFPTGLIENKNQVSNN
jgi:hypothetical protein